MREIKKKKKIRERERGCEAEKGKVQVEREGVPWEQLTLAQK